MMVWKLARSIAHSLQFVAALIVAVLIMIVKIHNIEMAMQDLPLAVVEDRELAKELAGDHH